MRTLANPLLALMLFLPMLGCRNLDPSGPYAGDKLLYTADDTITTGKDLLDLFLGWEKRSRTTLAGVPEVRRTADHIRANGKQWFATAIRLRETYNSAKTDANASALREALKVIQVALMESSAYLTKYGPAKAP